MTPSPRLNSRLKPVYKTKLLFVWNSASISSGNRLIMNILFNMTFSVISTSLPYQMSRKLFIVIPTYLIETEIRCKHWMMQTAQVPPAPCSYLPQNGSIVSYLPYRSSEVIKTTASRIHRARDVSIRFGARLAITGLKCSKCNGWLPLKICPEPRPSPLIARGLLAWIPVLLLIRLYIHRKPWHLPYICGPYEQA